MLDEKRSLVAAVALVVGFSVLFGMVGADARWLAALGHDIVVRGRVPDGVPFAAAPTVHWHNVVVLAELIFWMLESALGDRGLVLAQSIAVALAFGILAADALGAGATRQATASTCLLAALGGASSLVIARAQLFSLALFPALLVLLRSDARVTSRRIWLVPALLALWSNLHGAVLVGLMVTFVYLGLSRLRRSRVVTISVGAACVIALCANPGGIHAFSYFVGVLSNAAARRGEGLWSPLSPTSPFDAVLIVTVVLLALRAARARISAWEGVVLLLTAAMTVHASRSGIWLLLMLVTPAAIGTPRGSAWRRRVAVLASAALVMFALGLLRGPTPGGVDGRTVAEAIALARGTPILTTDVPAEQIALAGGRVWASNPIDAFAPRVQLSYLEWTDGDRAGLAAVARDVRVVLVGRGSPSAALMRHQPDFRLVAQRRTYELFEKNG